MSIGDPHSFYRWERVRAQIKHFGSPSCPIIEICWHGNSSQLRLNTSR